MCGRDTKCFDVLETLEGTLEEWWGRRHGPAEEWTAARLEEHLCVASHALCCPAGSFGRSCKRCPANEAGAVCNGRGTCSGDGQRTGLGTCACHATYAGVACEECAPGYDAHSGGAGCEDRDECSASASPPCPPDHACRNTPGAFECIPCDPACAEGCSAAGPGACTACKPGFERNAAGECEARPEL